MRCPTPLQRIRNAFPHDASAAPPSAGHLSRLPAATSCWCGGPMLARRSSPLRRRAIRRAYLLDRPEPRVWLACQRESAEGAPPGLSRRNKLVLEQPVMSEGFGATMLLTREDCEQFFKLHRAL